jgi:MFS family permease
VILRPDVYVRLTSASCYTAALSCGVSGGIIIAGLVTINHSWRYIYYVATALIGGLTILVFFTMPETSFNRSPAAVQTDLHKPSELYTHGNANTETAAQEKTIESHVINHVESLEAGSNVQHKKRSYAQGLRIFNGKLTNESLLKIFIRPVALLLLPPVLWATLVMSVTIGFLVAISSNFASAFSTTYGFLPWQSGLCFVAGIIGSLLGLFAGGHLSDWIANKLTQRNGGIREPEMRLPAVTIGLIASPLALVLYGVGIDKQLHWIVPTLGLGLCTFSSISYLHQPY